MIAQVVRLTRWEWFKLRRRWMPWILLAIAAALCQVFLWSMFYSYNDRLSVEEQTTFHLPGPVVAEDGRRAVIPISCADIWEGTVDDKVARSAPELREETLELVRSMREERCPGQIEEEARFRDETRRVFVLPDSVSNGLGVAHSIGVILIMILGASAMGIEYGWGTLRAVLTRGVSRWQFLGAKALSLVLFSVAGLLVVSLTVVVSSLIAASLTLGDGGGLAGAGQWSTVAVMFGKATYVLVAYAILALFLTVLTSSSSMGIAMSLAYYFAEFILGRILGDLFAWFDNVSDFLIGFNTAAWMSETGVVTTEGSLFPVSDPPGELHAFLVLLAYIIVLGAAAFWLFQRRDVAGARGE